jgi:hypothetical protein
MLSTEGSVGWCKDTWHSQGFAALADVCRQPVSEISSS